MTKTKSTKPFFSYTTYTTYGINTESTYDWQTREWSVPINLFVTQLFKVGHKPMSLQAGPRYWVDNPKDGAEGWGFRVAFTLLFRVLGNFRKLCSPQVAHRRCAAGCSVKPGDAQGWVEIG